jgi:hypothetical protein
MLHNNPEHGRTVMSELVMGEVSLQTLQIFPCSFIPQLQYPWPDTEDRSEAHFTPTNKT